MKKNILFISGLPDHHIVLYNYMSPPDWNKRLIMLLLNRKIQKPYLIEAIVKIKTAIHEVCHNDLQKAGA